MAKGIAINICLNSVDAGHYQGWFGQLLACEADAKDAGIGSTLLLRKRASRKAVFGETACAEKSLKNVDRCLVTYSGDGGELPTCV